MRRCQSIEYQGPPSVQEALNILGNHCQMIVRPITAVCIYDGSSRRFFRSIRKLLRSTELVFVETLLVLSMIVESLSAIFVYIVIRYDISFEGVPRFRPKSDKVLIFVIEEKTTRLPSFMQTAVTPRRCWNLVEECAINDWVQHSKMGLTGLYI